MDTLKWKDGDMVRDSRGYGYATLSGLEKTKQDVSMVLTTDTRRSTGIGCGLDSIAGVDSMSEMSEYAMMPIAFDFQSKVKNGINTLIINQLQYDYSERGLDEIIQTFTPVGMEKDYEDPRDFTWSIDVRTESGSAFTLSGIVGGDV